VAPGLLIAERYRLEALIPDRSVHPVEGRSASRVGQLWQAHDLVLARSVAVLLVSDDDPVAARALAGARAVASLTNPAMAKVYDAGESPGVAFVVTEYFTGGSLEQQLHSGPLDTSAAIDLVAGIATAIADAHDISLYGMTPSPNRVLFTTSGAPRLAGVALAGEPPDGAVRTDTTALAHLLYAALTGRWPGEPGISALPPAPVAEGHLCTPRQVRGGVPRELDLVVAQALGNEHLRRGLPAITSPREFANALEPLRSAADEGHPYSTDTAPLPIIDPRDGRVRRPWWPARRSTRIGIAAGAVVLAVAIAGLFWPGQTIYPHFITHLITKPTPAPSPTTASPSGAVIPPAAISEFDPYGDHNDPHVSEAPRAIDGDPATAWHTQTFASAKLGNRKPGVGLLVDLGDPREVASVRVGLLAAGTTVELLESNGPTAPATDTEMTMVASANDAPSEVTLRLATPTSARYWLVWLTKLPAGGGGFQSGVAEVVFQS